MTQADASSNPEAQAISDRSPSALRRNFKRGVSLTIWARLSPNRIAIKSGFGDRTFVELEANCNRLARALMKRGVGPDDGLALFCANRPEFVEVMFAAERAGIRVTPIRSDLKPREVDYILEDSGAAAIIADCSVGNQLIELFRQKTGVKTKLLIGANAPVLERYEAALADAEPNLFETDRIGIPMIYTSGTTGPPKGVYRREPISRSAMAVIGEQLKLSSNQDLTLAPLALCRPGVFNLSVRLPLVCGTGVVLVEEYDPKAILNLIAQHRITYIYLTPFLLHRLSQLPQPVREQYNVSSLRNVLHTGAPCAISLKRQMIEWFGPVFTECYAGTEGGDIVISSDEWLKKPGSVGKAEGNVTILDENDNVLPANNIGRIFLAAPERGRFEYFNAPERTRSAYRGDHYTMGDHGYLDQDGYLYITGRIAEIINSGGLKIYPAEIDAILLDHPAIEDAACIGVPHPEMGEEVKALVKLHSGQTIDDNLVAELAALCRDSLAAYKCPSSFQFIDEVPRLPTGKVLREQLRRQYQ
jgi:long-chain acyl-CoA synthetase